MKAVASMFSFAMLFGIIIVAIAIVMSIGSPTLEVATTNVDIKTTESIMHLLDNAITEAVRDGPNAARLVSFTPTKPIEVVPEEDAVQFRSGLGFMDYFSRIFKNNIIYITGNDVKCGQDDINGDSVTDLVMENTFLKVGFQKVNRTTPLAGLNTTKNIVRIIEKTGGKWIDIADSSIFLDNNQTTGFGTGYSEILKMGTDVPVCIVHFFVNNTVSYDVFYRLYAGADFLAVEVRNIG